MGHVREEPYVKPPREREREREREGEGEGGRLKDTRERGFMGKKSVWGVSF